MALSEDDIKYSLKFYNRKITSAEFADYLIARNLKFQEVELELRSYGLLNEIQKSNVYTLQEFTAYLRMGEIVSLGDTMHLFYEEDMVKLYQSDISTLFTIDRSRVDDIFLVSVSVALEVTVRFGTRMHFDNKNKNGSKENGENINE